MGRIHSQLEITFSCEHCGSQRNTSVAYVKGNSEFVCSSCGQTNRFDAPDVLRKVEKALPS